MAKKNFCSSFVHYFFVYLPVLLITTLISIVYISYIFTYITYLIGADESKDINNFFLHHTTSLKNAKAKGYILLFLSLFLIIMLFICIFKTVFSNPGYFPNPLELEYKILSLGREGIKKKNNDNFLSKFSFNLLNGPMTSTEKIDFEKKFKDGYSEQFKDNPLHSKFSNDEIMDKNKRMYMEYRKGDESLNESREDFLDIYKGIDLSKMTLCGTCLRIKVERSHHCRQCQKCVLKMDHHCPWLANCIGFNNLKSFILLQFYGVCACVLVALTYWEAIVNYNIDYYTNLGECWFTFTAYLLNIGLFMFLLWLCFVNWSNLYEGMTVIENSERKRFPSTKSLNIYDMGPFRNFTNVFGRNPLVWFIPFFHNKKGNGYIFETNTNNFYLQ